MKSTQEFGIVANPTHRIVVTEPYDSTAMERLAAVGEVTLLPACDSETVRNAIVECNALLVRTATVVDAALLESAPRLRVIGRGGVGLDNIDVDAATRRGVVVVYTPAAGTEAVADLTVGFILSLLRGIPAMNESVRSGRFSTARSTAIAREMHELTLGIIGMGRIGRAVAWRCRNGFGMRVLYNDIVSPGWLDFVAESRTREALFNEADVVSLHVPLTPETRNLIDAAALAQFKTGAYLINTARGAIVQADVVSAALREGRLTGFATDVFDVEPPPANHPLLAAPNTILTPHIGAKSHRAQAAMNDVVDDVIRVLNGQPPRNRA